MFFLEKGLKFLKIHLRFLIFQPIKSLCNIFSPTSESKTVVDYTRMSSLLCSSIFIDHKFKSRRPIEQSCSISYDNSLFPEILHLCFFNSLFKAGSNLNNIFCIFILYLEWISTGLIIDSSKSSAWWLLIPKYFGWGWYVAPWILW